MNKKIRDFSIKFFFNSFLKEKHYYPISQRNFEDFYLVGFPKSGNTWLQHILASLVFSIDPQSLPDKLVQDLIPDLHARKFYKRFLDKSYFKGHILPSLRIKNVILIVRDGRDAMVSYFAMMKTINPKISPSDMVKYKKGLTPCDWNTFYEKWSFNPYDANILQIKFEDLIEEPEREILKISKFLGLNKTKVEIEKIAIGTSFNQMKKKEKKYGWHNHTWSSKDSFIRKGKVGSYKAEFDKELLIEFTNKSEEMLNFFGYI